MTRREIDQISFGKSLQVIQENVVKLKITFETRKEDVKAMARKILRQQKKLNANENRNTSSIQKI